MKKKILIVAFCVCTVLLLVGCGSAVSENQPTGSNPYNFLVENYREDSNSTQDTAPSIPAGNAPSKSHSFSFTVGNGSAPFENVEGISSAREISQNKPYFTSKWMLTVTQPIDWKNPAAGTFEQRVLVGYKGENYPTTVQVGGYCLHDVMYGTEDVLSRDSRNDCNKLIDGNSVEVEYRFFGQSRPEGLENTGTELWEHLTAENASRDFHHIIEVLTPVLGNDWVFSGTSKGGQATNAFAMFYPDDCRAYVSYVAPLCDGLNSESFMKNLYTTIGDSAYGKAQAAEYRALVLKFQVELAKNRGTLAQRLFELGEKNGCCYLEYVTPEILYDLEIMEAAITVWQYDQNFDAIAKVLDSRETVSEAEYQNALFLLMTELNGPDTWSTNVWAYPYYIQLAKENGFVLYDYSWLRDALQTEGAGDCLAVTEDMEENLVLHCTLTPEQQSAFSYNESHRQRILEWSRSTKSNVIMIYGGTDTWYPERIPDVQDNPNVHIYVNPTASHTAGINSLTDGQIAEIKSLLGVEPR